MASAGQSEMQGSLLCVLALTLLVGLIFGFVVLLSRVPVGIPGAGETASTVTGTQAASGYQFYSVLPEQTRSQTRSQTQQRVRPIGSPRSQATVQPAVDEEAMARAQVTPNTSEPSVLPVGVPTLSARSLVTDVERYREIPANNMNQEYLFLQVGNYRHAVDAERTRAAMLLRGFEAVIVPADGRDSTRGHRVRLGPYFDPQRAESAKLHLRQSGINYQAIRIRP